MGDNKQEPPRMTSHGNAAIGTKLLRTKLGHTIEVVENDYISNEIEKVGIYSQIEINAYNIIFNLIHPSTCIDIGANIGNHSMFFAGHCKSVYAFEPNKRVHEILERNSARNNLRIHAFNFGISDTPGEFDLYLNSGNIGASSFNKSAGYESSGSVSCRVERGDAVVDDLEIQDIDFIKIDAEGLEGNVISSLENTIAAHAPIISIEWDNEATRAYFKERDLFSGILAEYYGIAVTHDQDKKIYSGLSKVLRFITKHVLHTEKKAVFSSFDKTRNYDAVVFIPPRYKWIIAKLPLRGTQTRP